MGCEFIKKFHRELFWWGNDTDKHLRQMVGKHLVFWVSNDFATSPVTLLIGTSYIMKQYFPFFKIWNAQVPEDVWCRGVPVHVLLSGTSGWHHQRDTVITSNQAILSQFTLRSPCRVTVKPFRWKNLPGSCKKDHWHCRYKTLCSLGIQPARTKTRWPNSLLSNWNVL